jgi:type II secretory pathway component PulF
MMQFKYRAITPQGTPEEGVMSAEGPLDLAARLERSGALLLSHTEMAAAKKAGVYSGGIPRKELIEFTHHLIILGSSGIPILTGLKDIADETADEGFQTVLRDVHSRLEQGESLSDAMANYPKIFDDSYVSVVKAGESSGALEAVLTNLVRYLEWQEENKNVIVQATIYPTILGVAVIGLIVLLLTFLMPRIAGIFTKARIELPGITIALMAASDFLVHHGYKVAIGLVAAAVAYKLWRRTERGRFVSDGWKLKIPFFGELMRKIGAANFCYTLSTLYGAGMALPAALPIVAKVLKNAVLSGAVLRALRSVEEGRSLSEGVRQADVFQPLVVRMLAVGEETGNLEKALGNVNRFYDRAVPQAVKKFIAILEPLIIVVAGLVVTMIIMATLLPIFRLFKAVKS